MNEEQSNIMLNNALSVKNASIMKKFLTKDNFEVVRVKAVKPMKGIRYNTIVEIRQVVDASKTPPRYKTSSHKLMRVGLKEAMHVAGFAQNKDGSFVVPSVPDDVSGLIEQFAGKIAFVEDDVNFNKMDDSTCSLAAKSNSLGFVGYVTLTTVTDEEEEVPGETEGPK